MASVRCIEPMMRNSRGAPKLGIIEMTLPGSGVAWSRSGDSNRVENRAAYRVRDVVCDLIVAPIGREVGYPESEAAFCHAGPYGRASG